MGQEKYPVYVSILLMFAATPLCIAEVSISKEIVLAAKGRSDYQIVVPEESPSIEIAEALNQTARLVQCAFKANGFDLPVVSEAKHDVAKPGIYLGNTERARAVGVIVSEIKGWGYVHKVVGHDLIIAGRDHPAPLNQERRNWDRLGTVKGVADFLHQYAGTRFLYPDMGPWNSVGDAKVVGWLKSPAVEFLDMPVIAVPADLNLHKTPFLRFNEAYPNRASFYDIANNRFPLVDTVPIGHTYHRAIPMEKYYEEHPEYFALIGGERVRRDQYCISNPEVQELLYKDLIEWLDMGYDTVGLGQPDGFQPCQCESCKELFGTGEDWSEKLWILHRNLAERVLKARPGKTVSIMSYIQTALPPKTFKKFPQNTSIMLTGTNEEDIAPWLEYEIPQGFTGYLYNWCPNLVTRYTPMRTPRYVEDQAKRLFKNNINAITRDGPGLLYGLEGPVYYVMGRIFDDPENSSAKELVYEFCGSAFGNAANVMLQFYNELYHAIELYSEFLGTRSPGWSYSDIYGKGHKYLSDPFQLLGFLYTPKVLASLEKSLAQAEKSADTEKVRMRLALIRREFDYLKSLVTVIHLYHAYEISPDIDSRNRLLDTIDARNAQIAEYYNIEGLPGWNYTSFPPTGHSEEHLRLAYDGYQEPFKDTCLNWDTKAMRKAPPSAEPVFIGTEDAKGDSSSKERSLKEWREDYYRQTFEIPEEWKDLPGLISEPFKEWLFRADPLERGLKEGWYNKEINELEWLKVSVPGFWAETEGVGDYQGYAWYRAKFELPKELEGQSVRFLFGSVDEQAWVYVNGHLVREHSEKSEGKSFDQLWEMPFTAEVPSEYLEFGKVNTLVVRVHNSEANGGIWRPVIAHALKHKER
jgi:hypothetical protein